MLVYFQMCIHSLRSSHYLHRQQFMALSQKFTTKPHYMYLKQIFGMLASQKHRISFTYSCRLALRCFPFLCRLTC